MATRDLDRHVSRLGTATAALMVALSASVGVAVMVDSMRASVSDWLSDLLTGDLYISAAGFEDGAVLPAAVVERAPRLAAVDAYSSYRNRTLRFDGRRISLVAARLAPRSRTGFDFVVGGGGDVWQRFDRGAVIVSEPLAHRLGLAPGDTLALPAEGGEIALPVAAVFRDYASEHGRLFIALEHYRRHWPDRALNSLALFSGQGSAALLRAASDAFADVPDLEFTAAREIYDESMRVFDRTFRITEVLRLLSLLVAFIGVLSALMAVQLERRKEYAVLRALGLTRGQVSALIVLESAALGLLAALLAIPAGLAMAWVLTDAIQLRAFGWSMPFLVSPAPLLLTLLLGLAAAVLAALYPAWRASRHDPAPQLRED
jgi:putative ABC transport system permease protein